MGSESNECYAGPSTMRVTGGGGGETKKKTRRRKSTLYFISVDTVIAASTVYETFAGMDHGPMIEQELEDHKVRMSHATRPMDMYVSGQTIQRIEQLNFDHK